MFRRLSCILIGMTITFVAHTAIDTYNFKSIQEEQQFRELTNQLRCPKCQNNSIADSNAPIAADMRAKVFELMEKGQSRQEIITYMVDRYGNFVTYEPPVTPATIILWVIPALFVVIGIGAIIMLGLRRKEIALDGESSALSLAEKKRLQQLLSDENSSKGRT